MKHVFAGNYDTYVAFLININLHGAECFTVFQSPNSWIQGMHPLTRPWATEKLTHQRGSGVAHNMYRAAVRHCD